MKYHYVYRITNTKENRHYYGVRSSIVDPKKDLGVRYFSSSKDKDFINDQKENPQNYKYKVVRIFNDRKGAILMEIKLHARFNVGMNEAFYNLAKQTSVNYNTEGTKRSIESRNKQGDTIRGQKRPVEWCNNISKALLNHPAYKTDEFREKCRQNNLGENNPNYGKPVPEERKKKVAETLKKKPKVICPHCQKEGFFIPMARWHLDNCKYRKE